MAKTNNTRPYWVRVQDDAAFTEEWHYCGAHTNGPVNNFRRIDLDHVCDIDTGPKSRCSRHPTNIGRYIDWPSPPRDYIHGEWYGPDRARARDECRDAARDYNTHGDTDVIVGTTPHRHGASWHFW